MTGTEKVWQSQLSVVGSQLIPLVVLELRRDVFGGTGVGGSRAGHRSVQDSHRVP